MRLWEMDLIAVLTKELRDCARHRREQGYFRAASYFDRLVLTIDDCPLAVIVAVYELNETDADAEARVRQYETVGFGYEPVSAEQFCRDFIAERTS